jgi:hypothetical protein
MVNGDKNAFGGLTAVAAPCTSSANAHFASGNHFWQML